MRIAKHTWALLCLCFIASAGVRAATGPVPPGGTNTPSGRLLNYWNFEDTNSWTAYYGTVPVSFTNLAASDLGDGTALVIDSTNAAWLQFNVFEAAGGTNLLLDNGSLALWVAPNWSSTNESGTGPGARAALLEVGAYSEDFSSDWWSLFIDADGANLYFVTQTNGLPATTNIAMPIDWTTNRWHMVGLAYSPSNNSALYIDGVLATNGLVLTAWPGPDTLANGFFIGSDTNGSAQFHGMLDDFHTYSSQLNDGVIWLTCDLLAIAYYGTPMNQANLFSAPTTYTNSPTFQAVSGSGNLTWLGAVASGPSSANVWITNVVAALSASNTMSISFAIAGGSNGFAYDAFVNALIGPTNNAAYQWTWQGQGYSYNRYQITNLPAASAYLRLGTPLDSDNDGLTDAYELLISHTDPHNPYSTNDGILDGWKVYLGLNPLVSTTVQSGQESEFSYNTAGWLQTITGVRAEAVGTDFEGNVSGN